jgi:hypothetical protein
MEVYDMKCRDVSQRARDIMEALNSVPDGSEAIL